MDLRKPGAVRLGLLIATPTVLLLLPLPFRLARGVLALLSFFPALRSRHLLVTATRVQGWLWRLPAILNFRAPLSFLLRRHSLHCPLLIVFPHRGITRLVTVIPLLQLLLLLHLAGIAIP